MASQRITSTPPVVDVDGAMWTVSVDSDGVFISICEGFGSDGSLHRFDGEHHDGDTLLILDRANTFRLWHQLDEALEAYFAT